MYLFAMLLISSLWINAAEEHSLPQHVNANLFDTCITNKAIFAPLQNTNVASDVYVSHLNASNLILKQALNEFHKRHEDEVLSKRNVDILKNVFKSSLLMAEPLNHLDNVFDKACFVFHNGAFISALESKIQHEKKAMQCPASEFEGEVLKHWQIAGKLLTSLYAQKYSNMPLSDFYTKECIKSLEKLNVYGFCITWYYYKFGQKFVVSQELVDLVTKIQAMSTDLLGKK